MPHARCPHAVLARLRHRAWEAGRPSPQRSGTRRDPATGAVLTYAGFGFTPTNKGLVTWTVTFTDGDADVDVATAQTQVR
jgi:hypothetical protein